MPTNIGQLHKCGRQACLTMVLIYFVLRMTLHSKNDFLEKDQMAMSALELTKTNDAPFNAIYSSAINNNVASRVINLRQTFEEEITPIQS